VDAARGCALWGCDFYYDFEAGFVMGLRLTPGELPVRGGNFSSGEGTAPAVRERRYT
jgi:hypothetical protein